MDTQGTAVKSGNRVKCEVCSAEAIITTSNDGTLSCCDKPVTTTFAN